MTQFQIKAKLDPQPRRAPRSPVGTLFVSVDGKCFPERGWTDFPEAALASWTVALVRMLARGDQVCLFMFLDGPYELAVRRKGSRVVLRALRRTVATKREESRAETEMDVLVTELGKATTALSRSARRFGYPKRLATVLMQNGLALKRVAALIQLGNSLYEQE